LTAIPVLTPYLGVCPKAVGAAQRLSNGNYSFTAGQLGPSTSRFGQAIEVLPDGTSVYVLEVARQEYRSFRLRTLYEGTDVPPPQVESVAVNDGSTQRSLVTSLTVTFDRAVALDPGAFELRRQDDSLVGLSVATSAADGRTVAVLTFTGPDVLGGSLADGNYTLTVRGDLVHDRFGRPLDGDGDGTPGGDRADEFFRLYGDGDGDRDVDLLDLGRFLGTLGRRRGDPHILGYLDYDGDGRVGPLDLLA